MEVSKNLGYPFGGRNNKDYNILVSILGPPILGNYHILFQNYATSKLILESGLARRDTPPCLNNLKGVHSSYFAQKRCREV